MRGVVSALVFSLFMIGLAHSDGLNGTMGGFVKYSNQSVFPGAYVLCFNGSFLINNTANGAGYYDFTNLAYATSGTNYIIRAQDPTTAAYTQSVNLSLNDSSYNISQNLSFTGGGQNGTNGSISGFVFINDTLGSANVSLSGSSSLATISDGITGFYSFGSLAWPGGYGVQARFLQDPSKASQTINLNLTSGSYNITGQNLSINTSGGSPPDQGNCPPGNTFTISGYLIKASDQTQITEALWVNAMGMGGGSGNGAQSNSSTGFYNITCLQSGMYSVGAGGGGGEGGPSYGWTQIDNVNITAQNATEANITLSTFQPMMTGCGGAFSISGHVFGSNTSNPLSNVQLFIGSASGSGGPGQGGQGGSGFCGAAAWTNGSGFYNVTNLTEGSYMLNVMPAPDTGYGEVHFGPQQALTLSNQTGSIVQNFTLPRTGSVTGKVVKNVSGTFTPLANVMVNLFSPTPGGSWAGGQTDGSGDFNISAANGTYELNINPPYGSGLSAYRLGVMDGGGVIVASNAITSLGNITLRQGARIQGFVLDGSGNPITGNPIGINAHQKMMMGPGGGDWAFAMSQPDGSFEIAGLTENTSYVVEAHPDPMSSYSSASSEVYLSGSLATINLTLSTGLTVNGTVTCSGTPVRWAPVNIFRAQGGSGMGMGGPGGPMDGSMESGTFAFASTDEQGRYSARGLRAGAFSLRVELPFGSQAYNCSSYTNSSITLSNSTVIDVALPVASVLSGVVSSGGDPVANAFVNAFIPTESGVPEGAPAFGQTDGSGAYSLRVSPSGNEYVVSVMPPWGSNYAQQEARMNITASGQSYVKNFALTSGGAIRGKVEKADGTAVQFAFVNVFSENVHSFGFASTGQDGSFIVRGLAAARDYRLFIQPPTSSGGIVPTFVEDVSVTDGGTADLGTIVASSADSAMNVTITNNGTAISGARVHAWLPFTPFFGQCTTNSTGQCNIMGLSAGSYDIFIDAAGRPPVFQSAPVNGTGAFTFDYATSLGTLSTISGFVLNVSGGGVPYAEVGIWNQTARIGMHTTADENGSYSLAGVKDGGYSLGSRKGGYYDSFLAISVSGDTARNITLTGVDALSLHTVDGFVVSASGSSVDSKTVAIVDSRNASRFSAFNLTNSSGHFNLYNVPAANYTLSAVFGNMTYGASATVASDTTVNISVP